MDAALAAVGGTGYADAPVGRLSGGEQQRLRVAQALVGDPAVLLCDEPLLSLDLAHQPASPRSSTSGGAAPAPRSLFVTHEINPILPLVDRVLYLVDGRFRIGPPDEVMTSAVLSELYRTEVDVLRVRDRLVVVGADGRARTATARSRRDRRGCSRFDGHRRAARRCRSCSRALLACAVLGLVAGLLAPLIVARGMAFAVHGTAELAFTGGAAALLAGVERQARGGGRSRGGRAWCSACSGCASASATR